MVGGLTQVQAKCLAFVRAYIAAHDGASPSYAEIELAMGWHSKSRVHHVLSNLRARGFVTWDRRQSRSLTIVDQNAPYEPEALAALPTATLEALQADVRRVLHDRTVDAILAHHRAPAMDQRA